jgi:hypothetical protein
VKVGPYSDPTKNVFFNPSLVGKNKYFQPPPANYKRQNGSEGGTKAASTENLEIPDLVDMDQMPILAWMSDPDAVSTNYTSLAQVAAVAPGANAPAKFYMNSNYGMLGATALGKKLVNQDVDSLIGFNGIPGNNAYSLATMVSSPNSPKDPTQPLMGIMPTAVRGSFILHAAGKKGVYMGREEPGGMRAGGMVNALYYGLNFKTWPDDQLMDGGKPTSTDIMKEFDDIIVPGN